MVLNFNWMQKELPFRPRALNHCSETQFFIHQNSNYTVSTPLPMRKVCLFLYCKNPCFGIWWALGTPSCILLVVGAFSLQKAVETLEEVVSQQEVMRMVSEEETVSMWEVWFHNFQTDRCILAQARPQFREFLNWALDSNIFLHLPWYLGRRCDPTGAWCGITGPWSHRENCLEWVTLSSGQAPQLSPRIWAHSPVSWVSATHQPHLPLSRPSNGVWEFGFFPSIPVSFILFPPCLGKWVSHSEWKAWSMDI